MVLMTRLLEQAVAKARSLPEDQQDAIGRLVLQEIHSQSTPDCTEEPRIEIRGGIPVIISPPGSRTITSEDVANALDAD
jgi:hypothetical protein